MSTTTTTTTTTDYLNTRQAARDQANAEWVALNADVPSFVHNRLTEAAEWISNLQESHSELQAEYSGEVARYGDAWPGAQIQLADMQAGIAQADAAYDEVEAVAVAEFGYVPYASFVPARTEEIYAELTADWAPEPF